jgi:hypothetical protein
VLSGSGGSGINTSDLDPALDAAVMAEDDWEHCRRGIDRRPVPTATTGAGGGSVEAQVAAVLGAMVRAIVQDAHSRTDARTTAAREARRLRKKSGRKLLCMRRRGMIAYPKVQVYVLMGTVGSYTDFHIDFGGTSVWYHIVQGEKIFYVLPPTKPNLRSFEAWGTSPAQSAVFFPDIAPGPCMRVHLKAGDTFLIPPGWIHGVYTPGESSISCREILTALHEKFHFFVFSLITKTLTVSSL